MRSGAGPPGGRAPWGHAHGLEDALVATRGAGADARPCARAPRRLRPARAAPIVPASSFRAFAGPRSAPPACREASPRGAGRSRRPRTRRRARARRGRRGFRAQRRTPPARTASRRGGPYTTAAAEIAPRKPAIPPATASGTSPIRRPTPTPAAVPTMAAAPTPTVVEARMPERISRSRARDRGRRRSCTSLPSPSSLVAAIRAEDARAWTTNHGEEVHPCADAQEPSSCSPGSDRGARRRLVRDGGPGQEGGVRHGADERVPRGAPTGRSRPSRPDRSTRRSTTAPARSTTRSPTRGSRETSGRRTSTSVSAASTQASRRGSARPGRTRPRARRRRPVRSPGRSRGRSPRSRSSGRRGRESQRASSASSSPRSRAERAPRERPLVEVPGRRDPRSDQRRQPAGRLASELGEGSEEPGSARGPALTPTPAGG